MIKILYIYIGAGKRVSSVKDKILQIVHQFNQNDTQTDCKFFTVEVDKKEMLGPNVEMIPIRKTDKSYFKYYYQHRNNINTVLNYLEEYGDNYDVFFFRYPGSNKELYQGMKKYGSKILFEHNSKELEERRLNYKDVRFGFRPSAFLTWYQSRRLSIGQEEKWAPKVLAKAKMGIAVTDDIANYEKQRSAGSYHCETSPNGIIVSSVKHRSFFPYDGKNLNIALISGASTAAPYLGVDRILAGLKQYHGDINIKLFCVGKIFEKEKELADEIRSFPRIEVVGELDGPGLDRFFEKIHVSLGSLGLHRINMTEGSVMKVNDSLSRGVPVIVGHDDMELKTCPEYASYILKVPADESPLDFNQVNKFVSGLYQDPEHSIKIRKLAESCTDLSFKVSRLITKIESGFALNKNV